MKENRCIIFSGGSFENPGFYKCFIQENDYIICVDGGLRYAHSIGVKPNLVVGDMDTISHKELEDTTEHLNVKVIRYPREKDFTDTHIALLKALELGYKKIIILAALGGRIDHTLANIMLLALPEAISADVRIIEKNQEICLIRNKEELKGVPGQIVSLLPLSKEVKGINTKGLYYEMKKGTMCMGVPIGISNIMTEESATVELEKGLLLAIYTKEEI